MATCDEIEAYVSVVYEPTDIVEVRCLRRGTTPRQTWHEARTLAELADDLENENSEGFQVYVGANPRREEGGATNADVACARCLFADFDGSSVEQVQQQLVDLCVPTPSMVICSGHGVHCYCGSRSRCATWPIGRCCSVASSRVSAAIRPSTIRHGSCVCRASSTSSASRMWCARSSSMTRVASTA